MKKLTAILSAAALVSSPIQAYPSAAADAELESLAKSLGADTEYISLHNYIYNPKLSDAYYFKSVGWDYMSFVELSEESEYVDELDKEAVAYADSSFGISALEVIAHNGLITPADIAPDAKNMTDITDSYELRKLITSYQSVRQRWSPFWYHTEYLLKGKSLAEKAELMSETAEKCQKDGKYFLIMYSSFNTIQTDLEIENSRIASTERVHSAVGIGIKDGNWKFNGKSYDKCVLTLDSQNVGDGTDAFDENTCIFIDSKNGEMYSPMYSPLSESELHIIAVDDDKLINYGQALKPTDSFDTYIDDIVALNPEGDGDSRYTMSYSDKEKGDVTIKMNEGFEQYYKRRNGPNFLMFKADKNCKYVFDYQKLLSYFGGSAFIYTYNKNVDYSFSDSDCLAELGPDKYKFTARYDENNSRHRKDGVMPYRLHITAKSEPVLGCRAWSFQGDTKNDAEFEFTDEGLVINGSDGITTDIFADEMDADEAAYIEKSNEFIADGKVGTDAYNIVEGFHSCSLTASGRTLVTLNDGKFTLKIDLDGDGKFEHTVGKGDVNCDGKVDARDATILLHGYSAESIGEKSYVFMDNGDCNGDGKADARDASEILAFYSKNSTN